MQTGSKLKAVDIGVITIREDEYNAVHKRLKNPEIASGRHRTYVTDTVQTCHGVEYRVAVIRCVEQGPNAGQDAARDLIEDCDPQWLAVVGIGGAVPDTEFTLGDVVLAKRLHDFTVGAFIDASRPEFIDQGGPMKKEIQDLTALLGGLQRELAGWETEEAIGVPRPDVELAPAKFYGSLEWRQKTENALRRYFGVPLIRTSPIATDRAIASSGFLIKDPDVISQWQASARDLSAVEMELAGVYNAARRRGKEYPVLAIRGISDIVGFKRDPAWTEYACHAAASFFFALLRNMPRNFLIPKGANASEQVLAVSSPLQRILMDVSVIDVDRSPWNRGEDTKLRYSLDKSEQIISIEAQMGYLAAFKSGGLVVPLNYMSPTLCPFKWDFPTLDFKVLNNTTATVVLTEIVFDIEESRLDPSPLFAIRKDAQRRNAGSLILINEGWCDLRDLTIAFKLLPGEFAQPVVLESPYPCSITLPVLNDREEIDVTDWFRSEGVEIDDLILLGNAEWDRNRNIFVVRREDGVEERMTETEMEGRWKTALGPFEDEVGTLVGEIRFACSEGTGHVGFNAPVYLSNKGRLGIPKPPSYAYDVSFDIQSDPYQRRVQISHELRPGESDRFTTRIAIAQTSFFRFRATLRDIAGGALQSLPVEMSCFVPRSRRKAVENALCSARQ